MTLKCLKFTISCILCYFVVINHMRANLLAASVYQNSIDGQAAMNLYTHANDLDPCNSDILNALGDVFVRNKNHLMASIQYGKAMLCSPGNALMRFKFGETLLMDNYLEGRANVIEAALLEPNNPYFKNELIRLKTLLGPPHE